MLNKNPFFVGGFPGPGHDISEVMNTLPSAKGDTVFLFSHEGESLVEIAV